jgi:FMN reductase
MPVRILAISGSPTFPSRTGQLIPYVRPQLEQAGFDVDTLLLRDLPAEDLLRVKTDSPALKDAAARFEQADGILIASPVYKAGYTGLLKSFIDVLPQYGLQGKVVLPVATGGSLAHVLAIDYGLRPVLMSMLPRHVVNGLFILDKQMTMNESGQLVLEADIQKRLADVVNGFIQAVTHP